jgi:hypothetical protein
MISGAGTAASCAASLLNERAIVIYPDTTGTARLILPAPRCSAPLSCYRARAVPDPFATVFTVVPAAEVARSLIGAVFHVLRRRRSEPQAFLYAEEAVTEIIPPPPPSYPRLDPETPPPPCPPPGRSDPSAAIPNLQSVRTLPPPARPEGRDA